MRGTEDAEAFQLQKLLQLHQHTYVDPSQPTVGAFLDDSLRHCEAREFSPSTVRGYRGMVSCYIVQAIGKTKTPATHHGRRAAHVRQGQHDRSRQGRGRRLEQSDRVPHPPRALDRAQLRRRPTVPADQRRAIAHPPRPEDREMRALDVDAVQKMLTALETWPDHRLRAIALIAIFTGLSARRAARPSLAGRGPRARHRDGGAARRST